MKVCSSKTVPLTWISPDSEDGRVKDIVAGLRVCRKKRRRKVSNYSFPVILENESKLPNISIPKQQERSKNSPGTCKVWFQQRN